jgi:hypothetical protein
MSEPERYPDTLKDLEKVVTDYLDRLNRGESIDPLHIFAEHPKHGAEILEELEVFRVLSADVHEAAAAGR